MPTNGVTNDAKRSAQYNSKCLRLSVFFSEIVTWNVLITWPWEELEGHLLTSSKLVQHRRFREQLNSSLDEVLNSCSKLFQGNLRSRQPQSCHVQSRAGHKRRPLGHLWRRGRTARGPSALLSVWMTALWTGHGLGTTEHTHIHTAAATTTRCPRWARHWPTRSGKQKQYRRQMMNWPH